MLACLVQFSVEKGNTPILQKLDLSNVVSSDLHDYSQESQRITNQFLDGLKREYAEKIIVLDDLEATPGDQSYDFYSDPAYLSDILSIEFLPESLKRSIYSTASTTFLSADERFPFEILKPFVVDAISLYRHVQLVVNSAVALQQPDSVVFFNGRSADQVAILDICREVGVKWFCLERSTDPEEGFFFEDFTIQDRVAFQEYAAMKMAKLSESELHQLTTWTERHLKHQSENPIQNPFLKTRRNFKNSSAKATPSLVPIYLSSLDEDLGAPGFESAGIRELLERTVEVSKSLITLGHSPVVVIHPNALNKSWNDLAILYAELNFEEFASVWPWNDISSYDLLSECTALITWRSSLGLEGMARGKRCFLLTESFYDLITDAKCLRVDDIEDVFSADFENSPVKAMLCYYWLNNRLNAYVSMNENPRIRSLINNLTSRPTRFLVIAKFSKWCVISFRLIFQQSRISPKEFLRFFQIVRLGKVGNRLLELKLKRFARRKMIQGATY